MTVHFNAVCDRFSPSDTTFSIADAKELKDTKLSAACSLHAASGSTSSSTSSLRRRRLMEITEEEEEEERERKRQSVVKEEERPKTPTASEPPIKLDANLARSPEASRFANENEPPHFMGVPRPSSPATSFDDASRRMSSQSSRTDLYLTTSHPYSKPRVKLGPRPSADLAGRPRSSAGGAAHRPVATVPAGLKSASKGSKKGRSRSHSQDDEGQEPPIQEQAEESSPQFEAVDLDTKPLGNEPVPLPESIETTSVAPTSVPKVNVPAAVPTANKPNTMTPEKARLLKAMKLREKKKMLSLQPALEAPASEIPSAPSTPGLPDEKQDTEVSEGPLQEEEATTDEGDAQEGDPLSASNVDSGIDVGTDQASVDTQTDSLPASPLATSEIGDSTQASSLSDSTDETVLAKDEHPELEVEAESADIKPAASSPASETLPAGEVVDGADPGTHDRQSQATIVAEAKDGGAEETSPVALSSKTEQNATALDGPAEASHEILDSSKKLEEGASEANPTETVEAAVPVSSTPEPKPTEADPHQEGKVPSPQFRIPLSKFSTQETKSPTSAVAPSVPSIVAHTTDVDSWRVGDSAPPVPEKDSDVGGGETTEATEATGTEPRRRILPGPIRTDLDAPDNDKRRSVISILDNDGFMDELQSATVQQATPITVSKSPISPFFALDQAAKRPAGPESIAPAPRFVRTVSNPVRNSFLAPGETSASPVRSASSGAAYLQKISQQTSSDARPKSSKLGSSISQRIKALEKLSGSSPGADASHTAPKERPASTFFAVRKAGTREPSRSPSVVDRAGSVNGGPSPSPPGSRESSPEALKVMGRGRSDSLVNRLSMFEGGMPPRGRPESVQVRARIIRDPNQPFPKAPESKGGSAEYSPLDLKQSPLVVDVQNRVDSRSPVRPSSVLSVRTLERDIATQAKQSLLERRLSKQSQDGERDAAKSEASDGLRPRRRSSLSFVKGFIKDRTDSIIGTKSPSTDNLGNALSSAAASQASPAISRPPSRASSIHQAGSLARRLSISSRRSSIDQNSPALSSAVLPTPRMADGADLGAEAKSSSSTDEKKSGFGSSGPASPNQSKGSRASRFMRRLSNSLVTSRKNSAPSISPTVAEEDAADVEAASRASTAAGSAAQSQPSIVAFMGDVNVQFPDNLLWKRRSICLDNQGFLILSAVQGSAMMHPAPGKDRHGAMVKRYHMSDFKPPYAPDVELQELPNSVVLDLVDGSGLQIACEDRAGQMSILRSKFVHIAPIIRKSN